VNVAISLGSNLGDRLGELRAARDFLITLSADGRCRQSPVYETEPVDCPPNSPRFLNAVVELDYDGEPHQLLARLQAYETSRGRDRHQPRHAARPIDLDILYCGPQPLADATLCLPHPRLTSRRFVLEPLAAIAPDRIVPGTGKTVARLLAELPARPDASRVVALDW
jgi:2-amino-4-hydroxy-6-hydroxymethyldihydropteridine diphosphokinase